MVSLQLVFGSAVFGAEVEALKMRPVCGYAKCNADKAPSVGSSVTTEVHFNCAILKGASQNDSESASIVQTFWTGVGNTHGTAAEISNCLRLDVVELKLVKSKRLQFLLR